MNLRSILASALARFGINLSLSDTPVTDLLRVNAELPTFAMLSKGYQPKREPGNLTWPSYNGTLNLGNNMLKREAKSMAKRSAGEFGGRWKDYYSDYKRQLFGRRDAYLAGKGAA